jgi:divalent metal cation (Fe/Co/Zn/Cd) transporter
VLMDRTPEEAREAAEHAIADVAADIELVRLRLRESAGRYFADVVVAVPPGQAVVEGHRAADLVEAAVQRTLPGSDVVVHVEPRSRDLSLRDRVLAIALEEPLVLEAHDIMIFQRPGGVSVALHLKFPADLDLGSAAQIAARVERAIADRLHVAAVQTHLEPLEQTLRARAPDQRADAEAEAEIERLVSERTGSPPRHLELLSLENGRVVFLTLGVAAGRSLADAHALAGELEEQLRARVPDIVDVVVRTQP